MLTVYDIYQVKPKSRTRKLLKRFGRITSAFDFVDQATKRIQRQCRSNQVGMPSLTYEKAPDGVHAFFELQVQATNQRHKKVRRHYVITESSL